VNRGEGIPRCPLQMGRSLPRGTAFSQSSVTAYFIVLGLPGQGVTLVSIRLRRAMIKQRQ